MKTAQVLLTLAGLLGVFALDWMSGYEVSVAPLYMCAVAYVTWSWGLAGGLIASLLCVGLWWTAGMLNGHHSTVTWILVENVVVRLLVFFAEVIAIANYLRTLEVHRDRIAALERLFVICHHCGKIAMADGKWIHPSELKNLGRELYRACPSCVAAGRGNLPKGKIAVSQETQAQVADQN